MLVSVIDADITNVITRFLICFRKFWIVISMIPYFITIIINDVIQVFLVYFMILETLFLLFLELLLLLVALIVLVFKASKSEFEFEFKFWSFFGCLYFLFLENFILVGGEVKLELFFLIFKHKGLL